MARWIISSLGLCLAVASSWLTAVHGQVQDFCENSEALAVTWLNQAHECTADLSACAPTSTCGSCGDGGDSGTTSCADGCAYSSDGYEVERVFTGTSAVAQLVDSAIPLIRLAITHIFTAGAVGNFSFSFSGTIVDLRVVPASGGLCFADFNGVECGCEEIFCDATGTTFAHRIDCSAVEGGAVIDRCIGIPLSTEPVSLLEILYAVPFRVCNGFNLDGSPITATTMPPASDTDPTTLSPAESSNESTPSPAATEPALSPESSPESMPNTPSDSDSTSSPIDTAPPPASFPDVNINGAANAPESSEPSSSASVPTMNVVLLFLGALGIAS